MTTGSDAEYEIPFPPIRTQLEEIPVAIANRIRGDCQRRLSSCNMAGAAVLVLEVSVIGWVETTNVEPFSPLGLAAAEEQTSIPRPSTAKRLLLARYL